MPLSAPLLLLGLSTFAVAGCRVVEPTRSGFLPTYDGLSPLRGWGDPGRTLVRLIPGVEWWRYGSVVVEPMQVRLTEDSPDDLSPGQVGALIDCYERALERTLPVGLDRILHPRQDSILVRTAITQVDTTSTLFHALTTACLLPLDTGGATLEIELRDGGTGRSLVLFVNADQAQPWNFLAGFHSLGHARQSVSESARWVGATLSTALRGRAIPGG